MRHKSRYNLFTIKVISDTFENSTHIIRVQTEDRFYSARHRPERLIFRTSVTLMEKYLRRHSELTFEDPKNHVRRIIYLPPALRAWASYMPGGFATHHVHNPDHKRLTSGEKIDFITHNLFKHSIDAIGLRSRAYAMTWFVDLHRKKNNQITWLSIACGSGQPTFDAAKDLPQIGEIHLADIDKEILSFAKKLATAYELNSQVHTHNLDVRDTARYKSTLQKLHPNVIEAMGIAEYLRDSEITTLIQATYQAMRPGDIFIFSNMLDTHPHLEVHRRGLGWPGVVQRGSSKVRKIIQKSGVPNERLCVIIPGDDVYAIYAITK